MKPISKIAFPVAAMAAALISSCGGGGEGQDYYVSIQQFENGSKAFRFIGSPSCDVYGNGGYVGDKKVSLQQGFRDMMTKDIGGGTTNSDFDDVVADNAEVIGDSDGGTIVEGGVTGAATTTPSHIAYYVAGGSSGKGYLYVTFQSSNGIPDAMIHLMGCTVPTDIIAANTGQTGVNLIQVNQAVITSRQGCVVRAEVNFQSGMARLGLCFQVWDRDQHLGYDTYSGTGEWRDYVTNEVPFIAIDR